MRHNSLDQLRRLDAQVKVFVKLHSPAIVDYIDQIDHIGKGIEYRLEVGIVHWLLRIISLVFVTSFVTRCDFLYNLSLRSLYIAYHSI